MITIQKIKDMGFDGIRVIPDVHGMADDFIEKLNGAKRKNLFVLQLGDIVDRGNADGLAMKASLDMVDEGAGEWVMGNHEWKHYRAFIGNDVRLNDSQIIAQKRINDLGLVGRFVKQAERGQFWLSLDNWFFVHAAYHPAMDRAELSNKEFKMLRARAMYGETDGSRINENGFPVRLVNWVHKVPKGKSVFVGHHVLSVDHVTRTQPDEDTGEVFFMDMGSGFKDGVLTYVDLNWDDTRYFGHNVHTVSPSDIGEVSSKAAEIT